eukprot:4933354-Pyramimonas_sp.AAC.3
MTVPITIRTASYLPPAWGAPACASSWPRAARSHTASNVGDVRHYHGPPLPDGRHLAPPSTWHRARDRHQAYQCPGDEPPAPEFGEDGRAREVQGTPVPLHLPEDRVDVIQGERVERAQLCRLRLRFPACLADLIGHGAVEGCVARPSLRSA